MDNNNNIGSVRMMQLTDSITGKFNYDDNKRY